MDSNYERKLLEEENMVVLSTLFLLLFQLVLFWAFFRMYLIDFVLGPMKYIDQEVWSFSHLGGHVETLSFTLLDSLEFGPKA